MNSLSLSAEGLLRVEGDQPDALPEVRGERPHGLQAGDAAGGADRGSVPRPGGALQGEAGEVEPVDPVPGHARERPEDRPAGHQGPQQDSRTLGLPG